MSPLVSAVRPCLRIVPESEPKVSVAVAVLPSAMRHTSNVLLTKKVVRPSVAWAA